MLSEMNQSQQINAVSFYFKILYASVILRIPKFVVLGNCQKLEEFGNGKLWSNVYTVSDLYDENRFWSR